MSPTAVLAAALTILGCDTKAVSGEQGVTAAAAARLTAARSDVTSPSTANSTVSCRALSALKGLASEYTQRHSSAARSVTAAAQRCDAIGVRADTPMPGEGSDSRANSSSAPVSSEQSPAPLRSLTWSAGDTIRSMRATRFAASLSAAKRSVSL